jgi:hypothetical protein
MRPQTPPEQTGDVMTNTLSPQVCEATEDDLSTLRSLLDLGLQPLEQFDGFDHGSQFGPRCYRMQLNFSQYALALYQYTRTPAFSGYLAEAQRNFILKMCDKRVWGYWARESLVGYLRWQTDPIKHANVMYSGWFGFMLGLYETLNDDTFSRPGSLSLRWNEQIVHEYDFTRLAQAVQTNMAANKKSAQYPCEPHLIFPMCNAFAMNTLAFHDRLHNDETAAPMIRRVRESYRADQWLRDNDRFVTIRVGPSFTLVGPTVANDAGMVYTLSPVMPDVAERTWAAIRDNFIEFDGSSVTLRGRRKLGSERTINSALAAAAMEIGETDIGEALLKALDDNASPIWQNGARRSLGESNFSHVRCAFARYSRPHALRNLVNGNVPDHWRTGPRLAEAAYPDVLVSKAISDGLGLELVLFPGDGPQRVRLGIDRLRPGASYRSSGATGSELVADDAGRGYLDVDLSGRTEITISPVGST